MYIKILYALIVFQVPLGQIFGFGSFYYLVGGYMLIRQFIGFVLTQKLDRKLSFFLPYLIVSVLLLLINLMIDFHVNRIIMFASLIWLPLLFFFRSCNSELKASSFFRLHVLLSLVGALAGIVEFYFSRDLFGLVPRIGYTELYDNFDLFYRTRSIFYSTQINALFQSISIILMLQFRIFENKIVSFVVFLLILFSIFLTGSRSAIFIPVLFAILKFPLRRIFILFTIGAFGLMIFISNNSILLFKSFHRQFDVILNLKEFILNEWRLRFDKQINVLESSNVFLGNGIGSTYSGSLDYLNAESYYVQMFSEFGIVGLCLLVLFLIGCYHYSKTKLKPIILVMLMSGFFVHGLSSPYLLMFWLILFSNENII